MHPPESLPCLLEIVTLGFLNFFFKSSNSDYVEKHSGENITIIQKKKYGSLNDLIKQLCLGSLDLSNRARKGEK